MFDADLQIPFLPPSALSSSLLGHSWHLKFSLFIFRLDYSPVSIFMVLAASYHTVYLSMFIRIFSPSDSKPYVAGEQDPQLVHRLHFYHSYRIRHWINMCSWRNKWITVSYVHAPLNSAFFPIWCGSWTRFFTVFPTQTTKYFKGLPLLTLFMAVALLTSRTLESHSWQLTNALAKGKVGLE